MPSRHYDVALRAWGRVPRSPEGMEFVASAAVEAVVVGERSHIYFIGLT